MLKDQIPFLIFNQVLTQLKSALNQLTKFIPNSIDFSKIYDKLASLQKIDANNIYNIYTYNKVLNIYKRS